MSPQHLTSDRTADGLLPVAGHSPRPGDRVGAPPWHLVLAASLTGGLTISLLGVVGDLTGAPMLIAAFGSSCVAVFLRPDAAFSRPANVIGGHAVAALCGLVVHSVMSVDWWSIGIAVALAMAAMALARVIHPPAGGTPIAIMVTHAGWDYLVAPVLLGAVVVSSCALLYRWILMRVAARALQRSVVPEHRSLSGRRTRSERTREERWCSR